MPLTCPAPWLQRVSLTGADDAVSLDALTDLGARYPFVEWALLYVPHHLGGPRNPTQAWREAFFERRPPGRAAVHLCFRQAFEQLMANELPTDVFKADRLQLNINARRADFTDAEVEAIFDKALDLGPELILQYQPGTAAVVTRFMQRLRRDDLCRVHVLLDASRGTGVLPESWTVPEALETYYCGFAGGLAPQNIDAVLHTLDALRRPCWVDMESGLRTDNRFDLARAEAILRSCAPYAAAEGPAVG